MALFETWVDCYLGDLVKIQYLEGNVFSMDRMANRVGVNVYDTDGNPAGITGVVTAHVIRSDGNTVAVTGSRDGNKCWVDLPQACYYCPGTVVIAIKLTSGTTITTLACMVSNVYQSYTGTTVDPGTVIPSIETLISSINTAVASIPADYSSLWTKLAPAFSDNASYVAGQYVTYNGGLYRFNNAHSGSWASGDVSAITLGGELRNIRNTIAPEFDENTAYTAGDFVYHNGGLYKIMADHASGVAWADTNKASATIDAAKRHIYDQIAPQFSAASSYVAGQYVIRNNNLYRFIKNHSGSWASGDVVLVNLGNDLTDLKSALGNAIHGGYNAVWQENPSAPFNDFDTLPNNSIILYSLAWTSANGISHGPNSSYGFVVTEAHNSDFANAKTQIAYDITGKTYTRIKYNSWTSWIETANAATVSSNYNETIHGGYNAIWQDSPSSPYNDMDTLPINSVLVYTVPWANVSHAPISTEKGMVLTFAYKSSDSAILSQFALTTNNKLYSRMKFSSWTTWKYYTDDKELTAEIVQDYFSSLSVFENIGILGDSFASGEIYTNSGNTHADYYNLSWGQILARKCGVNVYNYSVGGMSTRSFLTNNSLGLPKLLSDPARNLYIIAFGLNDGGISDYLGTADDMKADYTQNPDTFYGNYGRIIGNIKTHAPNAKIILSKMQRTITSGNYPAFNAAIGTIAEHFSLPCIDPMDDSFFTSTFYTGGLVDWHPTAILYGGMAEAYCRLFSKCAIAYRSYFADYVG